jgi:hypothetical protein
VRWPTLRACGVNVELRLEKSEQRTDPEQNTSIYWIVLVRLSMSFEKEKMAFSRGGGLLRTDAALRAGIHPRTLYDMRVRVSSKSLVAASTD